MSKWPVFTVFLCSWFLTTSLFGQWTQASGQPVPAGQYPQSQYPPQDSQYPQGQYPETQQQGPVPLEQQAQQPAPDQADLQHGVARISVAQGDVNVRRGDNNELTGAVINAPLVARDHVETSNGSRAEIQFDAVTLVRLAPNTDVGFADLQYHKAQVQLGLGTIIFRVLQQSPTEVEIDTPSVGVRAMAPGEYRISVFENGTSQISVHGGQAEILAPGGSEHLAAGRSVMVRGDAASPELQDVADAPHDQFDEWSAGRDQESAASQSTQYVNTDVQGAADLDRYGNWVPSNYGQAWQPQGVGADWSPYSNGQWSYVDYYGWSWVDYSPWGWAPYHYGRWFNNPGYGWCWYPGSRLYPAYYSPALVSFFGFGRGVGIGIGLGFGALGWVALAPFEMFHHWWGVGGGFGYRGYALGSYRNAAFRGGVLSASANGFAGPHQHFGVVNRSQFGGASFVGGRLPVSNIRAGMNFSSRAAVPNNRFSSVQSRSFYNGGQSRSFGGSSFNGARSVAPRAAAPAAGGWQHFGTPGTSAPRAAQGGESSGWHSFGTPAAGAYGASRSFQSAPSYQPRTNYSTAPRSFSSQPGYSSQRSYSQPSYSAPRSYSQPRQNYSAPKQQSSPKSAPAPHSSSGGGHSSGGGGGHSSGGGGHHR